MENLRSQVYVYVSTAAPASLQAGRDLRDQTFLSQLDYLATSNAAFDSVWRSPLPTAKFMISSYDAFLRPLHMRLPVIGFGDSAVACDDGHSVGARILRRISERYPVESIGTCMRNRNNTRFYNLGLSATSTETPVASINGAPSGTTCFFALDQFEQPTHRPGER